MRQVICVTERRGDKIVKNESAPIDLKFYVERPFGQTGRLLNFHAIWFSIHDIIGDLKISSRKRREGEGREGERKQRKVNERIVLIFAQNTSDT